MRKNFGKPSFNQFETGSTLFFRALNIIQHFKTPALLTSLAAVRAQNLCNPTSMSSFGHPENEAHL